MTAGIAARGGGGAGSRVEVGRWGVVPPKGSCVVVRPARCGRWINGTGLVVGPDQRYFPNPASVFVAFPSGMTTLLDVADLKIVALPAAEGAGR